MWLASLEGRTLDLEGEEQCAVPALLLISTAGGGQQGCELRQGPSPSRSHGLLRGCHTSESVTTRGNKAGLS